MGRGDVCSRVGKARNSGIVYHVVSDQKVWPKSIEWQVQEGCTGGIWLTDRAVLQAKDGKTAAGLAGRAVRIDRFDKGLLQDVLSCRDSQIDLERPHGEWHVQHFVNGKLAKDGSHAVPASGKILFQSE